MDLSTCEKDNLVKVHDVKAPPGESSRGSISTLLWSSRYATLSYCWGGDQVTKLLRKESLNIDQEFS